MGEPPARWKLHRAKLQSSKDLFDPCMPLLHQSADKTASGKFFSSDLIIKLFSLPFLASSAKMANQGARDSGP